MKKRIFIRRFSVLLILLLALSLILSSCGAPSKGNAAYDDGVGNEYAPEQDGFTSEGKPTEGTDGSSALLENRIVIKTVNIEGETKDFSASVDFIKSTVASLGGYVQSSDINSSESYYKGGSVSRANFTIRVPAEKLQSLLDAVGGRINVTYNKENIDDITDKYTDIEARISTLETQETRLLELLSKASSLGEIITLEEKLSEVRYQIESYTAQIRNYDTLVKYSTVYLTLREVAEYTEPTEPSFGARISEAFSESWSDFADGCRDFAVFLVYALPTLLILAVIAAMIIIIVRLILWRSRRASEKQTAEYNARMEAFKNQASNNKDQN